MPSQEDTTKAAFYYGLGIMGVIAGVGWGSTANNKVALVTGIGSLLYANHLHPVVDVRPRPELQESIDEARGQIPFVGRRSEPRAVTFDFSS